MIESPDLPADLGLAPHAAPAALFGARLTAIDAIAVLIAASMMLVCFTGVYHPYTGPRVAVLIALLPIGLYALAVSVARADRAALVASALLVWAVVSGALSPAPGLSLLGGVGSQQSALIVAGGLSAWAIGRHVSEDGVRMLGWTVVVCAAVSAVIALAQIAVVPRYGLLALIDNRPFGLAGHSVFFAAHMAAAAAWFAYRVTLTSAPSRDVAGFAVFVFLGALSGSRLAVGVPLLLAVVALLRRRRWGVAALIPVTIAATIAAAAVHGASNLGSSSSDRLTQSGSIQDRLDIWRFGLEAWRQRPLTGWGPGRFGTAREAELTDKWVVRNVWSDAHNLFVEILTTQGVVGVVLVSLFVVLAMRAARGPMAWMAGAIVLGWLLEPTTPATFGVALVLLGTGMRMKPEARRQLPRRSVALCALTGVALLVWSLAGQVAIFGESNVSTANFGGARYWYRWDPVAAEFRAARNSDLFGSDDAARERALFWSQRAVELEPDSPSRHANLALRYLQSNDLNAARSESEVALDRQPNQALALSVLHTVAIRNDDARLASDAANRLCRIDEAFCTPNIRLLSTVHHEVEHHSREHVGRRVVREGRPRCVCPA